MIADDGQGLILRRGEPASHSRDDAVVVLDASDGEIRRHALDADAFVSNQACRIGGDGYGRAEHSRKPCQEISGVLIRASHLEFVLRRPRGL